jgi:NAD(P)-dependent dehydrogenase (short-subunit alcohol dehydrogenase family)
MNAAQYPSLKGRVVVVTGGASGIGEAIVRAFAANGARVALLDIQEEAGTRLASELSASGMKAEFFACDLTDIEAVRSAFRKARDRLGPTAVLVNNAANDRRANFEDVSVEEFDAMMAVNLRHVFFASQIAVEQMRELGHGSIINMTSGTWVRGAPGLEAYATAKAAIVAPGMVITPRQKELWYQDESKIETGLSAQCIPERVEAEDVANLCLFLGADDSRMITKQTLFVNGGTV